MNWSVAAATFPLTVQLLALPEYTYHTLLGMVISCGGLSESTVCCSLPLSCFTAGYTGKGLKSSHLELFERSMWKVRVH